MRAHLRSEAYDYARAAVLPRADASPIDLASIEARIAQARARCGALRGAGAAPRGER
jgi:hypothetical protein